MASPVSAVSAYTTIAKLTNGGGASQAGNLTGSSGLGGSSFGSMLENVMTGIVQKGQEMDSKVVQMAAGKADLTDVVTAVAETEVAVETLVSVRDKVISAYEEIFRMPI